MKTLYLCCGLIGVLFLGQPAAAYMTRSETCYSFCNGPYARADLCAANCSGYGIPRPDVRRPQVELGIPFFFGGGNNRWDDDGRHRRHGRHHYHRDYHGYQHPGYRRGHHGHD